MLRTFVEDRTCESEGDPERDCEALCFAPSLRTGVDRAAAAVTVIAKALCFAPSLRGAQRRPGPDTEPNCEVLCFALSLGRPAHEHDRPRYCEVLCFAPSLRIKPLHSMADQTRIAELYVCAFVEENVYRLMHDDDEAGGAEGGSLGIHGVVGAEPSRRRPCESRNRRTGAEDRGGAGGIGPIRWPAVCVPAGPIS